MGLSTGNYFSGMGLSTVLKRMAHIPEVFPFLTLLWDISVELDVLKYCTIPVFLNYKLL
jgi:hypothetical protein